MFRAFLRVVLLAAMVAVPLTARAPAVSAAVLTLDACTATALRALIAGAVDGDVLLLPACTIPVAGAPGDDANLSGDFDITTSITLQGVGPDATILDGGGLDRVLDIRPGATVTLADLTVRNGAAQADNGGGVRNAGTATLTGVVVTRNSSPLRGGGIFNTGSLSISRSEVSRNSSVDDGGGIENDGGTAATVVDNCRIVRNSTGGDGGGIDNRGGGSLTVRESMIADNIATARGGGLENQGNSALLVERSAVSGNRAGDAGGGVRNADNSSARVLNTTLAYNVSRAGGAGISQGAGTVELVNSTVARNADASSSATEAGGISKTSGILRVRNSVVAQNTVGSGTPEAQADVVVATLDENLSNFIGTIDGNPRLGPLQDNGGPTPTMAPFPGSPLIETGNDALATAAGLATDQRGDPRILDGNQDGTATVDRGAIEVVVLPPPPTLTIIPLGGTFPSAQLVTLALVIRTAGRGIVGGQALFDGVDITAPLAGCVVPGGLPTGELTATCTFPAGALGLGAHTLTVTLALSDGTVLTRSVVLQVVP